MRTIVRSKFHPAARGTSAMSAPGSAGIRHRRDAVDLRSVPRKRDRPLVAGAEAICRTTKSPARRLVRQAFRCCGSRLRPRSGSRRGRSNARTSRTNIVRCLREPCRGTPRRHRIRASDRRRYAASVADLRATGPARPGHRRVPPGHAARGSERRACLPARPRIHRRLLRRALRRLRRRARLPAPGTNARSLPRAHRRRRRAAGAQHRRHRRRI